MADLALHRASSARAARASTRPRRTSAAAPSARTSPTRTTRSGSAAYVGQLDETLWQLKPEGKLRTPDWVDRDDEGERKTRVVEVDGQEACIFHNRQDFHLGAGLRTARTGATSWRRTRSRPSPTCAGSCRSAAPSATSSARTGRRTPRCRSRSTTAAAGVPAATTSTGTARATPRPTSRTQPLYLTSANELVALMGQAAYDELVTHCEAHLRSRSTLALHPADPSPSCTFEERSLRSPARATEVTRRRDIRPPMCDIGGRVFTISVCASTISPSPPDLTDWPERPRGSAHFSGRRSRTAVCTRASAPAT